MTDPVISVSGLSKRYLVGRRSQNLARYATLGDTIGRTARSALRKSIDVFRGRELVHGDEIEEFWALNDVSFEVQRGEASAIVGRNGAGKSTLLKILSRITAPDRGSAILRGRVASLLEVGTGFHPELTGRENIYLNGSILGMRREEVQKRFDEIVAFSEVEKFIDTPLKRYSSGMYMRLAFSVAAHLEPEILLVDEVLTVGDVDFQKKCLGKMGDVTSKEGRTVLMVNHNLAAVQNMCKSALLLDQGECVIQGDTSKVIQQYLINIRSAASLPLHARRDREGTGDIRFLSFSLEDPHRTPVTIFQCGSGAVLHFIVNNCTTRDLQGITIAVTIQNELGERVCVLDTALMAESAVNMRPGRHSFRFEIPKMPLIPGRYEISIYSTVGGIVADFTRNAAFFDVEGGDFYGSGQLPDARWAGFLLDHSFSVERDE
jgi:lipopolysaccharide transport system ATP-binding protein